MKKKMTTRVQRDNEETTIWQVLAYGPCNEMSIRMIEKYLSETGRTMTKRRIVNALRRLERKGAVEHEVKTVGRHARAWFRIWLPF